MILVGFMGAGKSSVGRALSHLLDCGFEDLDQRIERREGRRVHEIFGELGETGFRQAERAALEELLKEMSSGAQKVVALGGGAFAQSHNVRLIEAAEVPTIFLDAAVAELWRRCRRQASCEQTERPLLGTLTSFGELYIARRPHYLKASYRQQTGGKTVDEIAAEVVQTLGLTRNRRDQQRGKPGEAK